MFAQFGKLLEVKVIYNRETAISKGFAFVQYEEDEKTACFNAIRELNGTDVSGRRLVVKRADEPNNHPRGQPFGPRGPVDDRRVSGRSFGDRSFKDERRDERRPRDDRGALPFGGPDDENKVFVAGFDYAWTEQDLSRALERFGKVADVKVRGAYLFTKPASGAHVNAIWCATAAPACRWCSTVRRGCHEDSDSSNLKRMRRTSMLRKKQSTR